MTRIVFDLSDEAEQEIARLSTLHNLTNAELFRSALTVLRIISNTIQDGGHIEIHKKNGDIYELMPPWIKKKS